MRATYKIYLSPSDDAYEMWAELDMMAEHRGMVIPPLEESYSHRLDYITQSLRARGIDYQITYGDDPANGRAFALVETSPIVQASPEGSS